MPILRVRNVTGNAKARFHSEGCRECFEQDKAAGLIYGLYRVGGKIMDVYDASIEADFCAYCGTDTNEIDEQGEEIATEVAESRIDS